MSPLWAFDRRPAPTPVRSQRGAADELEQVVDPSLRCRRCGLIITWQHQRRQVNGRHSHRFANPHGHEFDIGCFAAAQNLLWREPPERFWTWFAGYGWQVVTCHGCQSHLGWRYSDDDEAFFGLIIDRLLSDDD